MWKGIFTRFSPFWDHHKLGRRQRQQHFPKAEWQVFSNTTLTEGDKCAWCCWCSDTSHDTPLFHKTSEHPLCCSPKWVHCRHGLKYPHKTQPATGECSPSSRLGKSTEWWLESTGNRSDGRAKRGSGGEGRREDARALTHHSTHTTGKAPATSATTIHLPPLTHYSAPSEQQGVKSSGGGVSNPAPYKK